MRHRILATLVFAATGAAIASTAEAQAAADPLEDAAVARIRDQFKVDGIALFDPHSQHAARMGVCAASIFAGLKWCVSGTAEEKKDGAAYIKTTGYNLDADQRIVYAISSRRSYPLKREEFEGIIQAIGDRFGARHGGGAAVYAFKKANAEAGDVDSLIAVWGGLRLVHLAEAEYAVVEAGGSLKRGHLIDHRFNLVVSAKQRDPIYRIEGEAGYILHMTATSPDRADITARAVYQPVFLPPPAKPAGESNKPLVTETVRRSVSPAPGNEAARNAEANRANAARIEAERALAAERLLREEAERKIAEERAARAEAEKKGAEERRVLEEEKKKAEAARKAAEEKAAGAEDRAQRAESELKRSGERRAKEEAERAAAEELRKAADERVKRAERERMSLEERRRAEEAERKAAEKKAAGAEQERRAAEERAKRAEAEKKAAEEMRRREEAEKKAAEERARRADAERAAAEERRKAAEEVRRKDEAEKKAAEEKRVRDEAERKIAEEKRRAEAKRPADDGRSPADERAAAERKAEAERLSKGRAARPASWHRQAADAAKAAGAIWSLAETQDRVADERTLRTQTVFGGADRNGGEGAAADKLAVEVTFECTIMGRERRLRAVARGFDRKSGRAVAFRAEGDGVFGVRTRFRLDDQPAQDGLLFRERAEDIASILELPMASADLGKSAPRAAIWLRHYAAAVDFNLVAGTVSATITPYAENLRRVLEACAE